MKKISIPLLLLVSFVITGWFILENGEPNEWSWWMWGLLFWGANVLAYVVFAGLSWYFRDHTPAFVIMLLGFVASIAYCSYSLYDAFHVHLDPQSGMILLALPVFQFAMLLGSAVLAFGSRALMKNRTT